VTRPGDEATDRLLRRRFREDSAASAAPAEPCPDAEILAAYVDRSLSTVEAQSIESHAASCGACTQMLAMLVDSDPEAAAGAVPEDDRAPASAPAWAPRAQPPASSSWWRWGFAIPALAAVLVLGVWLSSMRPDGRSTDVTDVMARNEPAAGAEKASEAAPPAPASSESAAQPATALPGEPSRAGSAAASQQERPSAASDAPSRGDQGTDAVTRKIAAPRASAADERRAESPSSAQPAGTARPAPETFAKAEDAARDAAPALADAPTAAEAASAPGAAADASSARAARASGGAPERERTAAQAQRGAGNERQQDTLAFAPAPLLLTSGNGRVQWRVIGTSIARSNDGGSTWQADVEAPRPVTAGAIAADGTVWLGGRRGLVLRRAASGWTTVTGPAAVDVVSVTEASATAATVTLADGRRMRTEDAGRTWVAR
jgi:hypothetical protein